MVAFKQNILFLYSPICNPAKATMIKEYVIYDSWPGTSNWGK
jgi:hypothetical protein